MNPIKKQKNTPKAVYIRNKEATFHYILVDTYRAGIVLQGTEVKSIRQGHANLKEAFAFFKNNELFLKGMHISPYTHGSHANHDPQRLRKLLLTKRELKRIKQAKEEKKLTIIPLALFIENNQLVKVQIATAKGKKSYDKRAAIKDRDLMREQAKQQVAYKR